MRRCAPRRARAGESDPAAEASEDAQAESNTNTASAPPLNDRIVPTPVARVSRAPSGGAAKRAAAFSMASRIRVRWLSDAALC